MERRDILKLGLAAPLIVGAGSARAAACETDGTPLQFIPKAAKDANPLADELAKYPKCPYCGMDRKQFHHSRHLVHYGDDLVDGTCSIHCLAISLAINLDREPKAIYGADFGSAEAVKPLVEVAKAQYLIGSKLPGVMTARSKKAFADPAAAAAAQQANGGELGNFDAALTAAYADLAKDTLMIRRKREERRKHMQQKG